MLAPSIATFLVTIINIGILFFVLRALLFKPVTKFMEDRTRKVEDALAQSEKDRTQAKALLAQYEKQIRNAEGEAAEILQSARENARHEADRIIAEGKNQADTILTNARKQIDAEQKAALAEFRKNAAFLVIAASGRILGREFKSEDDRRYAGMLLEEIGKN
ncbi:MAG: F0F1 ATP synthase subunit B [Treponema sp.]|jgi:F-type H+-transporting ATPase subunit b|nr:F0F1 ATP synthase subunit B [Treponema sp.]